MYHRHRWYSSCYINNCYPGTWWTRDNNTSSFPSSFSYSSFGKPISKYYSCCISNTYINTNSYTYVYTYTYANSCNTNLSTKTNNSTYGIFHPNHGNNGCCSVCNTWWTSSFCSITFKPLILLRML